MNENVLVERVSKILGHNVQHERLITTVEALADKVEELNKQLEGKSDITLYVQEAYETAKSKGWHDEPTETGTKLALIHAEVSEALEADRKGDKENFAEELADVCIRIFDLCGSKGIDLHKAIRSKMDYNKTRAYKHGGKKY
jgi:NTP pyrophosphatase (non-canonical NTP hydrolase)